MKYPYRKSIFWGCRVVFLVGIWLVAYISTDSLLMAFGVTVVLYGLHFLVEVKKSSEKYIELHDETIRFSNHRYGRRYARGFAIPSVTFDVKYRDIFIIKAKTLPLVGVRSVLIEANEKKYKIKVNFTYSNFKDLYINICKKVKEHNPDAYIDSSLNEYLE